MTFGKVAFTIESGKVLAHEAVSGELNFGDSTCRRK